MTIKDIEKTRAFPNAAKDAKGRLLCGAAVGVGPDREARVEALLRAGCDVLVVDTAHGHSRSVLDAVRDIRKSSTAFELVAGNVATADNSTVTLSINSGPAGGTTRAPAES